MLSQRPFKDRDEVFASAERIWSELSPADWLEAFKAHPRIGETTAERPEGAKAEDWSKQEQAGLSGAADAVRALLAQANRDYESRFGWIYLVCASGKSPEELLAMCRARMAKDPDAELRVAAAEQLKITHLRLERLLTL